MGFSPPLQFAFYCITAEWQHHKFCASLTSLYTVVGTATNMQALSATMQAVSTAMWAVSGTMQAVTAAMQAMSTATKAVESSKLAQEQLLLTLCC